MINFLAGIFLFGLVVFLLVCLFGLVLVYPLIGVPAAIALAVCFWRSYKTMRAASNAAMEETLKKYAPGYWKYKQDKANSPENVAARLTEMEARDKKYLLEQAESGSDPAAYYAVYGKELPRTKRHTGRE